ncbi:MAG: GNAT family N-acetyltransferase [Kiritimatiellae bacterium]|nr:GNAT family N-acetyltransferase [Kiritimatiellia bacterium]
MSLQLLKASTSDAPTINGISKRAFDSDVSVGAPAPCGPPGYMSVQFHAEMAEQGHLYKLAEDGLIVGGALLFPNGDELNVGRIFVAPEHFRKGYGIFMMREIEKMFPGAKEFTLDTPCWNIRTNSLYPKLGYAEVKRGNGFVFYSKRP